MPTIKLRQLQGLYAIARLQPSDPIPAWADGAGFVSVGRTDEELSVVCLQQRIPDNVRKDLGWGCFKFEGPFAFDETGIMLSVVRPLSENDIGVFVVSTFDTDHLLLKTENIERSKQLLIAAGHIIF
jgi:hypothetical protein